MKDVLNHTQSYNYDWSNQIKKYDYRRTHLAWEKNPIPERVTTKMVKKNDLAFNLILQKYNDKSFENKLKQSEQKNIIDTIIKNQDNQLKIEQTFNIINLQDRLKGFESHPDHPINKDKINTRKKINYDFKNYNILSNLPLSLHHYDKPEKRPKFTEIEKKEKKFSPYKYNQERDYDIISSKYKCYNDEKVNIDKELSKIQTANIFYKFNDYNPIKGAYFNQEKEENFQKALEEKNKNWGKEKFKKMPKCARGRSDIYDLISLKVVDDYEFNKMVTEEKNKKKRYQIRNAMDKYYREKNIINQDKEEIKINEKAKYKVNIKKRDKEWDKIISNAGKNNTFSTKSIFRQPYDSSEVDSNFDNFRDYRKQSLTSLPKIQDDKNFKQKKRINKCISYREIQRNPLQIKYEFNKNKFFNEPPKDVVQKDIKKNAQTSKNIKAIDKEYMINKMKNTQNRNNIIQSDVNDKK